MKVDIATCRSANDITLKNVFGKNGTLREVVLAMVDNKLLILNLTHKGKRTRETIMIDEFVFNSDESEVYSLRHQL